MARKVGEVRRVLVASPAYLAARGEPKAPADLEAHDTILGALWSGAPEWRFGAEDRATVVRLTPRLLVNDAEAVLYRNARRSRDRAAAVISGGRRSGGGNAGAADGRFRARTAARSTGHAERGAPNPEAARVSRSRCRRSARVAGNS